MKKAAVIVSTLAVAATGLVLGANPAAASINGLAKAECRSERATDRAEFIARFGGTGSKAIKRCVKSEIREAYRNCRQERRFEPQEFAFEYGGTGSKAIKRCVVDELR